MKVTIVGFTGRAGSGKDTIAQGIIEARGFKKVSLADPLYRISRLEVAKQNGDKAAAYELFKLCLELFGGPMYAPPVKELAVIVTDELTKIAQNTGLIDDVLVGTKPRKFLQYVGTDFFRAFDEDVWVDYFIRETVKQVTKIREDYLTAIETGETSLRATGKETVEGVDGFNIPSPHVRLVITDVRFDNEGEMLYRLVERLNDIAPDVIATKHLIKLDISVEQGADRVSSRDDIPVAAVMANMGHASEAGVADDLIDNVVDASRPIQEVGEDIIKIIDGSARSLVSVPTMEFQPGARIVDLSQYAKKKE